VYAQTDVLVPEEREDPQGVGGPPVVLVAVDHDGAVARDAVATHQRGERLAVDVVTLDGVVEVEVPVDLDGALDVARLVEQDVLVGLDHDQPRLAEVLLQPLGAHETLGVGVLGEAGGRVVLDGHGVSSCRDRDGADDGRRVAPLGVGSPLVGPVEATHAA